MTDESSSRFPALSAGMVIWVSVLLAAVLFVLSDPVIHWSRVLLWIEDHDGLSSWMQAVGTIGAIWWSWRIALRQSKDQHDIAMKAFDAQSKAHYKRSASAVWALAIRTEFALRAVGVALNTTDRFAKAAEADSFRRQMTRLNASVDALFAVPINELAEDFHMPILSAMDHALTMSRLVTDTLASSTTLTIPEHEAFMKAIVQHFNMVHKQVKRIGMLGGLDMSSLADSPPVS